MKKLTILTLDNDANGVSSEGIKVPRTLPGEEVTIIENKLNLIKPSEYRRHPVCKHYSECGGCTTQHATEEFIKDWKLNKIRSYLLERGIKTNIKPFKTSLKSIFPNFQHKKLWHLLKFVSFELYVHKNVKEEAKLKKLVLFC